MEINLDYIAKLARLGLTDDERKKYQAQVKDILEYVKQLQEVNIDGVEATSHATDVKNVLRKDKAETPEPENIANLVKSAPENEKGFIKVKKVFK